MQNQETKAEQAQQPQAALRAVKMGLFPTMNSTQEVIELAKAKIPVELHNDVLALLFTYHNTLLNHVQPLQTSCGDH